MNSPLRSFSVAAVLLVLVTPASALNIVLTNDDGFETANIQALYRALRQAGHNVILSAPYTGQSGTSGRISFLRPIGPTRNASEDGLLSSGSPGVGKTTLGTQQYYVDGSPADSVLYGVDIKAVEIWGKRPDLVIAGPNEGNNLGIVTPHSGTLGATVTALNKGIPAIAVSADNGDPEQAEVVADIVVRLIDELQQHEGLGLPKHIGLNVNLPEIDTENTTSADYSFLFTRIGTSAEIGIQFFENLGDSAIATSIGIPKDIDQPGVSVIRPSTDAGYDDDTSPESESNALQGTIVTVSVIQATYAVDQRTEKEVRSRLSSLVQRVAED
jgi:5'-nucleotidase